MIPSMIYPGVVQRLLGVADGVGSLVATGAGESGREEDVVLPTNYRGVPLEGKWRVLVVFI
jgi:hypothetical protein